MTMVLAFGLEYINCVAFAAVVDVYNLQNLNYLKLMYSSYNISAIFLHVVMWLVLRPMKVVMSLAAEKIVACSVTCCYCHCA